MLRKQDEERESEFGRITYLSGELIVADNMSGVMLNELVRLGNNNLVGEITMLKGDNAHIKCYENASLLAVGDLVLKTGNFLSVELGPGLVNQIFDGIQRPLVEETKNDSIFTQIKLDCLSLNQTKEWHFTPAKFKSNQTLSGGEIIGEVYENDLVTSHKILLPPNAIGRVVWQEIEGNYSVNQDIIELEHNGFTKKYTLSQYWPIRKPRPISKSLNEKYSIVTGQRIFDSVFPLAEGGTCAASSRGGWSCITQSILKYSNTDTVIYVGCSKKSKSKNEFLLDLPELFSYSNSEMIKPLLKTTVIAQHSYISASTIEASIFTGITFAEYFRDQGKSAILIADSMTCWSEAFEESSRLFMPNANFVDALNSRINSFYDRSGFIQCIGSPSRTGSVTILSSIAPKVKKNHTDQVAILILDKIQVYWDLDRKLAQRKHFPSVNWVDSFSKNLDNLELNFKKYDNDFIENRNQILEILKQESIILQDNKINLQEDQKLIIDIAKIVKDDFLCQNIFSEYDHCCSLEKGLGMLSVICSYFSNAIKVMKFDPSKTWNEVKIKTLPLWSELQKLKFKKTKQDKVKEIQDYQRKIIEINKMFESYF